MVNKPSQEELGSCSNANISASRASRHEVKRRHRRRLHLDPRGQQGQHQDPVPLTSSVGACR